MEKKRARSKLSSASKAEWRDPDDAPEITDEWLAGATLMDGDTVIRRGRPPLGDAAKVRVTLRVDRDVVETYRNTGPGWQSRMNDTLRRSADRLKRKA